VGNIAALATALANSPAASMNLPAAELGLQIEQQSLNKFLGFDQQALAYMFKIDSGDALTNINAALGLSYGNAMKTALASFDGTMTDYRAAIAGLGLQGEQMQAAMRSALTYFTEPMTAYQEAVQAANKRAVAEITAELGAALAPRAFVDSAWLENFGTMQASWPGEEMADLYQQFDVSQAAHILIGRQAPAVISRRSEPEPQPPQNGNFGISPAQPGQPSGWQALLAEALRTGHAQPGEVIRLVAQVAKLPPVAELQAELIELETLDAAWQRARGRKTPVRFAADHSMSKATLYRRWARLKELRLLLEVWQ
jgi:hypothetical protein